MKIHKDKKIVTKVPMIPVWYLKGPTAYELQVWHFSGGRRRRANYE